MGAEDLVKALHNFPPITDQRIVVGSNTGDDATVYRLGNGQYLVQTLDFFTPVVDDPYTFGAIAAANAISDIYAMGASPIFGLNIVAFPIKLLGHDVLREILRGGNDKALEAGFFVSGGHSIDDAEPKYGMVVSGLCPEAQLLTNSGVKAGDVIVLTKPLGVGILTTAVKKQLATESDISEAVASMAALNKPGGEAAVEMGANAATDITGFGLIGHMGRMAQESGVTIEADYAALPVFDEAVEFVKQGIAPGGTRKNLAYFGDLVDWRGEGADWQKLMVADSQTSGGLVISVSEDRVDELVNLLKSKGALTSAIIGRATESGDKPLIVKF